MRKLKGHLTYANVVATLALIVAVAGGSTAIAISAKVKKNSVSGKQIKKGTIRASNIKSGAITADKIADGNVTGPKLAPINVVTTVSDTPNPGTANATCPGANERLLGGGAYTLNGAQLSGSNRSSLSAPTWEGSAQVVSAGQKAVAQAVCLSAKPGS